MQPPRTVCIEAELSSEFGNLVQTYRKLKIHHKTNLALCLFLFLMSAMLFLSKPNATQLNSKQL